MEIRTQDAEQLRLLSIFHYVVAGLAALFACLPVFHLLIGFAMVTGWGDFAQQDPMAGFMGWFFILFAGAFMLAGWTFAVCLAVAGRFLAQRRHYTYCLVMAGVACAFGPFGTVLGVFAIIALTRDSVKDLFGRSGATVSESQE